MSEHVAPGDDLSPQEREALIHALTPSERRAIALTLEDLRGWATLHGQLRKFDPQTGAELSPPVRTVGIYDRRPRPGLPTDWIDLFIRLGWIEIVKLGNGWSVWKPTAAGASVREQWLPEHIRERG
ncbi:hypothetical protein AB0F43_32025 [Kribbella sp. NPDC023972]|uniref:hypothetical protein n=1 Tax=Kribbella sp. NPDC023972 TaxID=3154795 RepID=UPI0033DDAE09